MTKPKPTIIPNREFNAAILDRITAHAMPADQREDEFSIADLVGRGMSRGAARTFTDAAVRANKLARRIGIVRATGRRAWMYRIKEDAHK